MKIGQLLKQNLIGKLFNHAIVFCINILLVRILGVTQSGYYFNELYVLNFIAFFFRIGLDYSAIEWISKDISLVKKIHNAFTKLLVIALGCLMMGWFVFSFFNCTIKHVQTFWVLILFATGNIMMILFQGILSALKKFNLQNWVLILSNFSYLIFLLLLIYIKYANMIHVSIIGYALLFFIQGFIMLLLSIPKNTKSSVELSWTPFFKHGAFIMISSLIYFCFVRVDNFFVEHYCDAATLSNYVQCGKVGQYFIYFSSIVSSTIIPFVASENVDYKEWRKIVKPYVAILLLGAIFLAAFGRLLYPLIFGEAFIQMQQYMIIFIPGFLALSILTLLNSIYLGKRNIKKIFRGDLLGLLLVLLLDCLFVPLYGAIAAAIISSCVYCIVCMYLLFGVKNEFNHKSKSIIDDIA